MADLKKTKGDMARKMVKLPVKDNNTKNLPVQDMNNRPDGSEKRLHKTAKGYRYVKS